VVIATGSAFTKLEENGELATKAPSQPLHETIHRRVRPDHSQRSRILLSIFSYFYVDFLLTGQKF